MVIHCIYIFSFQVCFESICEVFVDPTDKQAHQQQEHEALIHTLRSEVIQTLILVFRTAKAGHIEDARSQVKIMLDYLIKESIPDEPRVQCLIETLLVVYGDLESIDRFEQVGCKRLEQLKQAHTQQRNNITSVIIIPDEGSLLRDLDIGFELKEQLDLSTYEGLESEMERSFRHSYLSNYCNIQAV